jgi:hypothetical protein
MNTQELITKIENLLRTNTKPGYFDKMGWSEKQLVIDYALREVENKGTVTIPATFHMGTDGNRIFEVAA